MIAELGQASLVLCFVFSLLLAASLKLPQLKAKSLATAIFMALSFSFLCLVTCFGLSDFSVYAAFTNSHSAKPMLYKLTGTWGNHEGSMLLWVWVLGLMTFAYAQSQTIEKLQPLRDAALGLLGMIIAGFAAFILLTSNPFDRIYPPPWEGNGLNPLLQDIGLAIHPPLLYFGYVGFAIISAQAVAALLIRQKINPDWAKHIRPWALLAWSFLSMGIGLGSWWAYRELGWGGWWFWDPVENVSLLPWLSATALIHCIIVLSKRPALQNWTVLLAISTFTFSLLGTFLVRSGVLTSVHSFANDPARGMFILGFVGFVTLCSLWLYASRYPKSTPADFLPISKEGSILVNNLLLTTLCATVFLGIVYPLLLQAFNLPSVSVGAPYYEQVFLPIAAVLILLAAIGPLLPWKQASWKALKRPFVRMLSVAALIITMVLWSLNFELKNLYTLLGIGCGAAMIAGATVHGWRLHKAKQSIAMDQIGMVMAHAGLGILAVAATLSGAYRMETEMALEESTELTFSKYVVTTGKVSQEQGKNYEANSIQLDFKDATGNELFLLRPESRFYPERGMETTEAAIHSDLTGDIYAAISPLPSTTKGVGEPQFALRLYSAPAMLWLWFGFIFIGFGGMVSALGHYCPRMKQQIPSN